MLGQDFRIVRYDGFVDTLVNLETHLGGVSSTAVSAEASTAVGAAVLSTDPRTGESRLTESEDAAELLARLARGSANVLGHGGPGSGKSTLLRSLAVDPSARRFRFYFDLGLKPKDEPFSEYAARLLEPSMASDRSRAYELFLCLIRSCTALCVLDAVDEGVDESSPAGFLRLFADLAAVLSAESAVIRSSRVSFLADSPQIRQLLDSGAGRSEQLVEQMYANGVDPARVPHFHLVRLVESDGAQPETPLERRLTASLEVPPGRPLTDLLGKHITRVLTDRIDSDGTSRWDHPDQPVGVKHHPTSGQLRKPGYYADPRYDTYPAVCVSWWDAFAFAAFEGKRLPTSLEWEAAARGADGRLFPWGDEPDSALINCADSWVGRPVVTYQAWYRDFVEDAVCTAWVTLVDEHPGNLSPFGTAEMVGNCWEWTSSSLGDPGLAAICGGSYDNPMRAVQASSKGLCRKGGASNAVGFRCVEDLTVAKETVV